MPCKLIQIGTGGFGEEWCRVYLPPNIKDGTIEVVAAVDVNPESLQNAKKYLKLRDDRLFTDVKKCFDSVQADCCAIVVPLFYREKIVDLALEKNLHILCEKPLADSMQAGVRIAKKVERAKRKMAVTMSHRFDRDKTTLRGELRSKKYGEIDYITMRYSLEARRFGSFGKYRHEMQDPLLLEGSVHHLDIITDLANSEAETVYAQTWTPKWGEYKGDAQALISIKMKNSTRAVYEGANCNAVGLNPWESEYIKVECEKATYILSNKKLQVHEYDPSIPVDSNKIQRNAIEGRGRVVPLLKQNKWMNTWLIEKFAKWINNGPEMETNARENLRSLALVFAAIESSRTGKAVNVGEILEEALRTVK